MFGGKSIAQTERVKGLAYYSTKNLEFTIAGLVREHGADAVREAVKKVTRKRRGRKQEVDFAMLGDFFEQDAVDWLEGLDSMTLRSNYAMAKHVSQQAPAHHQTAVHRRVMRKLASRREPIMLLLALQLAEKNRPHGDVFRVVEAMQASKAVFNNFGLSQADSLRGKLERYKERFGAVDPALTVPQIEKALEPDPLIQINKTIAGLLRDAGQ